MAACVRSAAIGVHRPCTRGKVYSITARALRYMASMLLLLSWRAKIFTAKKWHYFLLDFCYFINALCLVYLALTHLHPWCAHTRQRRRPSCRTHCCTAALQLLRHLRSRSTLHADCCLICSPLRTQPRSLPRGVRALQRAAARGHRRLAELLRLPLGRQVSTYVSKSVRT